MKNYLFGLTCVSYLIHLTCVKILWVSEWKIKLLSFPRRHSHLQSLHPGVAVSPSHKMLLRRNPNRVPCQLHPCTSAALPPPGNPNEAAGGP